MNDEFLHALAEAELEAIEAADFLAEDDLEEDLEPSGRHSDNL